MSQLAAEIAKVLTVAAVQSQPEVFQQDPKSSMDATRLGKEVAACFKEIYLEVSRTFPSSGADKSAAGL
jgi:hypothetical protein